MKSRLFHLKTLAFAIATLAIATPAVLADTAADEAVSVAMSQETPATISQGEPIILHYKVTNLVPQQKLGVLLGVYHNAWYTLTLTDQNGKSATPIPDLRPTEPRGLVITGNSFLDRAGSAEDSAENYIVVTQAYTLTHPGSYTLTAHVHLQYAVAPLSAVGPPEATVKQIGTTLVNDVAFPITVTPLDGTRLRQVGEDLRQQIVKEGHGNKHKALVAALFTMPEAQASASWEALASQNGRVGAEVIANALASVHSVKTTDLLVQMLDNPTLSYDEKSFIRTKIDESYNGGNATVKAHIKALAASRGGTMPEIVPIPQPSD